MLVCPLLSLPFKNFFYPVLRMRCLHRMANPLKMLIFIQFVLSWYGQIGTWPFRNIERTYYFGTSVQNYFGTCQWPLRYIGSYDFGTLHRPVVPFRYIHFGTLLHLPASAGLTMVQVVHLNRVLWTQGAS